MGIPYWDNYTSALKFKLVFNNVNYWFILYYAHTNIVVHIVDCPPPGLISLSLDIWGYGIVILIYDIYIAASRLPILNILDLLDIEQPPMGTSVNGYIENFLVLHV